jgi:SAM-dependent methyltransferase
MVSFTFAPAVRLVVAVDITAAMLAQAAQRGAREGVDNVHLLLADVNLLPFPPATFDLGVCRIAIHHFPEPGPIVRELRRVLRPGSTVVICDAVSDERPERAALHNRIERLRDSSHVRMLPESELRALLERSGLRIEAARYTTKRREFGEWTSIAGTPPEAVAEARALLESSLPDDGAGIDTGLEAGQLYFTHRSAIFRCRVG